MLLRRFKQLPRLEVHDLLLLLAAAETGSFRKAGTRLGIGQPGVTRRLQKLEDETGVSLFERRQSGAVFTSAGSCFIARAHPSS